ncbi:MAG: hypothetical protein KatS3mg119_1611 [Rhodothalassiaceae bacterium]|nr:MAG: hypothetical protein KatS3mg119_1611 [Rhodothalassiaceae bacterium]
MDPPVRPAGDEERGWTRRSSRRVTNKKVPAGDEEKTAERVRVCRRVTLSSLVIRRESGESSRRA